MDAQEGMQAVTVPICDECWRERAGALDPVRLREPEAEICQYCGLVTRSGIYVRGRVKKNGQSCR